MPALPSGTILLWSGSIASIPGGFVLCDGNNGTPDLRDRFVVGAGLVYSVDDTGGTLTHNHTFTSDGHLHTWPAGSGLETGAHFEDVTTVETVTGQAGPKNHLPPYFALVYIMKT